VVAFESDFPEDFVDLVMDLRESEASRYTQRDTPIFTCVHRPIDEVLGLLGG
jgi:chlorite dismutase